MEKKINLNKKVLIPCVVITILLEVMLFLFLKDSGAKFSMVAGMVLIPASIVAIFIMFSSLERAILISLFIIPMLPLVGYIMLRLNMLDYQYIAYIIFYLISAIAMLKNGVLKNIDKSKLVVKNKKIRILMLLLLVCNIIFAYNRQLTFMIVTLSFLPFSIYMYIIKTVKVESGKKFFDEIIYIICLACVVISIPDLIFFIINWIGGSRGTRGFGPLTGNYVLTYDLIALIICLNKLVKEEKLKNKWTLLVISLLICISTQISRGGYVTFVAIMIILIVFNIKNWKRYLPILLIGASCLTYNIFNRPDVVQDTYINDAKKIISDDECIKKEDYSTSDNALILKIVDSQSGLRKDIWKATIDISGDHPYFGVGLGNLTYFFDQYTTGKKGYSDAHNLFFNISSELGIPFMILSIILLFYIGIDEFIKFFKTRDKEMKLNRLTMVVLCVAIFLYGNLTGIALQLTVEVYSFTQTFILIALLTYRDCLELK